MSTKEPKPSSFTSQKSPNDSPAMSNSDDNNETTYTTEQSYSKDLELLIPSGNNKGGRHSRPRNNSTSSDSRDASPNSASETVVEHLTDPNQSRKKKHSHPNKSSKDTKGTVPPKPNPEKMAKEPQMQKRVIAPRPIIKEWPKSEGKIFMDLATDTCELNKSTKIITDLTLMPNCTDAETKETEIKLIMSLTVESNIFQEHFQQGGHGRLELQARLEVYDRENMVSLSRKEISELPFPKGKQQIRVDTSLAEQAKVDKCDTSNLEIRIEPRVDCYTPMPQPMPERNGEVITEDSNNRQN